MDEPRRNSLTRPRRSPPWLAKVTSSSPPLRPRRPSRKGRAPLAPRASRPPFEVDAAEDDSADTSSGSLDAWLSDGALAGPFVGRSRDTWTPGSVISLLSRPVRGHRKGIPRSLGLSRARENRGESTGAS